MWVVFKKTQYPTLVMRKAPDKFQWRNIPQNTYPVLLKTAKVMKNKESCIDCPHQMEPKEI